MDWPAPLLAEISQPKSSPLNRHIVPVSQRDLEACIVADKAALDASLQPLQLYIQPLVIARMLSLLESISCSGSQDARQLAAINALPTEPSKAFAKADLVACQPVSKGFKVSVSFCSDSPQQPCLIKD